MPLPVVLDADALNALAEHPGLIAMVARWSPVVMTPHPGTVKTEVPVRLPRPRDPLSVDFLEYQKLLMRHLSEQAG